MFSDKSPLYSGRRRFDFSFLLFLLSVVLSVITTYYVSAHYIDSDTSSELVLAQHWIETGNILSADWLYGSELRLFHVQLIYVPLMLLFDDWLMVRYIGALIMQAIYVAAFGCLVLAAGKGRRFFFLGAALLLLPASVTYGRIVLYHNHYLPNITISFLLLALSISFSDNVDWLSKKTWLRLFLLTLLSLAGGLNSIRQLMITHVPLLLSVFCICWLEDAKSKHPDSTAFFKPPYRNLLFCSIYSAAISFLGLKMQNYICGKLGLNITIHIESNTINLMEAGLLNDVLYGFFHQFGFRSNVPLFSVSGILTVGSIFIGCYLLFISVKRLINASSSGDLRKTLLAVFFLAYNAVMILLFFVTESSGSYHFALYLSLSFSWAVPLVLTAVEDLPSRTYHPLHPKKFFAAVTCILLVISGAVNTCYFQGSEQFPQIYEGLNFRHRDKKEELSGVVSYLSAQGYDRGYAMHWEGNIVTEMTDGQISMVAISMGDVEFDPNDDGTYNLFFAPYLYPLWYREAPCEKPFLLLTESHAANFHKSDSSAYCTQIYSGYRHVAYSIDDLDAFTSTLYS